MGTTPYPVIADDQSKMGVPWRSSSITPEWLIDSVASFGWQFEESQLGERDLTIADGAGAVMPSPPVGLDGFPGVEGLPHLAYARMAVDGHSFSNGGLWLYVEVTDISEAWGRKWADYILAIGSAQAVPLGKGYAGKQLTVIDAGDRLIRANWGYTTAGPGARVEETSEQHEVQLLSLQPQGS